MQFIYILFQIGMHKVINKITCGSLVLLYRTRVGQSDISDITNIYAENVVKNSLSKQFKYQKLNV